MGWKWLNSDNQLKSVDSPVLPVQSMIQSKKSRLKVLIAAIVGCLVSADKNRPIAVKLATNRNKPKMAEPMAMRSSVAPTDKANGMHVIKPIRIKKKPSVPKYFPSTICVADNGADRSRGKLSFRRSSAMSRMVTSGVNNNKMVAALLNKGNAISSVTPGAPGIAEILP